jgi:hypothetical protein
METGHRRKGRLTSWPMAVNPDPRPGRWLLPLVILAMVGFTYVFVESLPAAESDLQDLTEDATTTSTTSTTVDEGGSDSTTTTTTTPTSPEVVAYLEQVTEAEGEIIGLQAEMGSINSAWDADPREISYGDAEAALQDLAARVATWADEVEAIPPPVGLEDAHDLLGEFAQATADAAAEVLVGLQAPDTGEARRAALEQFDTAVRGFTAAADDVEQRALNGTG